MQSPTKIFVGVCVYIIDYRYICFHMHVYMYRYMYMYLFMFIHMFVCLYMFVYRYVSWRMFLIQGQIPGFKKPHPAGYAAAFTCSRHFAAPVP